MKKSIYNFQFPHNNEFLLYNSFSDAVICLEPTLIEFFNALVSPENIQELQELHLDFFDALVNGGFLVDETTMEYDTVKSELQRQFNDTSTFRLIINPTMNCNFKCWYCYEDHIKKSKMSTDMIEKTNLFILSKITNNSSMKQFQLDWFGGEPLLQYYSVVDPIIQFAKQLCESSGIQFVTSFTSNGFLIDYPMIQSFKKNQVGHFQITLDGDETEHNKVRFVSKKRGSYQEIIQNIQLLIKSEINVSLRFNCSGSNIDSITNVIPDLIDVLPTSYLIVELHQVWQTNENFINQFHEIENEFSKNGFEISRRTSRIVDNACYADKKNEVVINYDGNLFKCTARNFTDENKIGEMIEEGEVRFNEKLIDRDSSRFTNKPCMECKLFPICGGGCSEHEYENFGDDYCIHDFDESKKENEAKRRVLELVSLA